MIRGVGGARGGGGRDEGRGKTTGGTPRGNPNPAPEGGAVLLHTLSPCSPDLGGFRFQNPNSKKKKKKQPKAARAGEGGGGARATQSFSPAFRFRANILGGNSGGKVVFTIPGGGGQHFGAEGIPVRFAAPAGAGGSEWGSVGWFVVFVFLTSPKEKWLACCKNGLSPPPRAFFARREWQKNNKTKQHKQHKHPQRRRRGGRVRVLYGIQVFFFS